MAQERSKPGKTLVEVLSKKAAPERLQEQDVPKLEWGLPGDDFDRMAIAFFNLIGQKFDDEDMHALSTLLRMVDRRARCKARPRPKGLTQHPADVRWCSSHDDTHQHAYDFMGQRLCAPNIILASPEYWQISRPHDQLTRHNRCLRIARVFEGMS